MSDLGVSKEISQVVYKSSIKQLFALESNERPIHIDLSTPDSINILGQFSSEKTKEIRVITNNKNKFSVFAADNDDGLKLSTFEFFCKVYLTKIGYGSDYNIRYINRGMSDEIWLSYFTPNVLIPLLNDGWKIDRTINYGPNESVGQGAGVGGKQLYIFKRPINE